MKLIIPGKLVTLNEYILAERGNRFAAAKIKKEQTELVYYECKRQKLKPITKPVDIICTWYCQNKKKDPDNVSFGIKGILDGLVLAKVLEDDSWGNVESLIHYFKIDAEHPRIEVTLAEGGKSMNE